MSRTRLQIAIVGAGTAGAASAHFLARAGHRVTLFERVADPMPVGAGILLQPSGQAVLAQLGLLGAALDLGAPVESLYGEAHSGRVVMDMHYADWRRQGAHGLGLHRGALFALLQRGLVAAGVDCQYGCDISALTAQQGQTQLTDSKGSHFGGFDLVVLADGMRSLLRDSLGIPVRVRPYPWGALWAICEDTGQFGKVLTQRYRAASQMLGCLPTGSVLPGGKKLLSVFWSLPVEQFATWQKRGLRAWKDEVIALYPACESVMAQIHIAEQVRFADYCDVTMPHWHRGRVVVIGDAAHATSPQLGQGTNLALVDAWELQRALATEPNVPAALAAYSRARRDQLAYYQWASKVLTPFFQSPLGTLPLLRDAFMGYARHLPYVRHEFANTVAGTKTGLFAGRFTLPG